MKSAFRTFFVIWIFSACAAGVSLAQQNNPAAKADADSKAGAAKAAAAEIEKLEAARAAQAAQRDATKALQQRAEAAVDAARNETKARALAELAAQRQHKTAMAQAAAEIEKVLTELHAAEAAGGANKEKTVQELQQRREQALAKYRALLAEVPAVPAAPAAPVAAPAPATLRAAIAAAQPIVNVQVVGDANNPFQKEMVTRLQPILKVELGFVNRVCNPTAQQRRAIAAAGEECLQAAATQYAAWQQSGQRGRVVVVNGRATRVDSPKPRQMIQDGIAKAVKENLPADRAALYVEQAQERSEFRKQLTVENLVSFLDDKLVLSAAQRAAIGKSLAAAWDENWTSQLQLISNGNQFFPSIPDQCVVPHLRDSQRAVWQAIPNRNSTVLFDDLQIQTGVTFDDEPDAEAAQ